MNKLLALLVIMYLIAINIYGQENPSENPLKKGVTYKFTEDGKYAMKIGFSSQLWARYSQLNPNTLDLSGEEIDSHMDFLIRRSSVKIQASAGRLFFLSLFGLRSQTQMESFGPFSKNSPQFFFYDAYASYSFFERHLYIGYGLHLYHGLSRGASASSVTTLGADVPYLAGTNAITTEQLARHLGLFVDGLAGSLHYRFVVASPFTTDSENRPPIGLNKAADIPNANLKTEGYLEWQFWDKELLPVPFTSGTYRGKKKMLNLGFGYRHHPNSTGSVSDAGDTLKHNQLHLAADIFMELPMRGGSSLTLYGAFFKFDFGPNYLLNGSYGNTFGASSPRGAGNVEPLIGSGSGISTQLGYLLPYKIYSKVGVQPFYEGDYRFYDALDDNALHHNFGVNLYMLDNNFMFTLQHELRPYFEVKKHNSNKSQFIFRLQILI
jgi:hypothetical protein